MNTNFYVPLAIPEMALFVKGWTSCYKKRPFFWYLRVSTKQLRYAITGHLGKNKKF